MKNTLKVYQIQKSLINQQMTLKRAEARKRVITEECECLFADILMKQIRKRGIR